MKKSYLGAFILFDLILITGTAFVLYSYSIRQSHARSEPGLMLKSTAAPAASSATAVAAGNPLPVTGAPDSAERKILFSYHSPRAKQVSIRADFTGWKAAVMEKEPNGVWTYQAPLTPGEYAYCFTADDKTFKDPANKRTKLIGRTMVSAIVVEPLPAKPPQ